MFICTLSHFIGAVRLACNLCLLYVKFGWLILCILLVIWVENFGKYFQVFWLSRCCQIRWPGSVTRDTVVPFHEIWSVEYFLRFAIELWIFIDVRQHYFQLLAFILWNWHKKNKWGESRTIGLSYKTNGLLLLVENFHRFHNGGRRVWLSSTLYENFVLRWKLC